MNDKPRAKNSASEQELDKVDSQFKEFDKQCKEMTLDRMNMAPKVEEEGHKISQADLAKSKEIYLKPKRSISSKERFNENYRKEYEHSKEYVRFIAKNNEIIGETIDMWTKPYAGLPAEWWEIPTGKPIWAPRYVAEQLTRCKHHRLVMQNTSTGADGMGQYYGSMAVDTTVQRLDAVPVNQTKSIFVGASSF